MLNRLYKPLFLMGMITGCSTLPPYTRPDVEVAPSFSEASNDWKQAEPQNVSLDPQWWEQFGDPVLTALEKELLEGNFSLKTTEAQYRQAKAVSDMAVLALFPTLTANVNSTRRGNFNNNGVNVNTTTISSPATTDPATAISTPNSTTNNSSSNSRSSNVSTFSTAQLSTQWEVDLWGKIRSQYAGSIASTQASAADLAQIKLSLQTTLATTYINLRLIDAQLEKLDAIRKAYQRLFTLTQYRFNAGIATTVDVEQMHAQWKTAEAQYVDQAILRAQQEHAMATLLGKAPMHWKLAPKKITALSLGFNIPVIPSAVPSTLLERRPDIAAAELRVAVANADIGVAKAAYFPVLTLNGTYGRQSSASWEHFFAAPFSIWTFGPSLAYSIFDAGARRVRHLQAKAAYEAAAATYKGTVLTAFQEVEDQLVATNILAQEENVQTEALIATQKRLKAIQTQVSVGTLSGWDEVSVQVSLLSQENTVLTIKGQRLLNNVALIKALGGGWQQSNIMVK